MLGESDLSNQACEQWGQRFVFLIPTRLAPLLFKQVCVQYTAFVSHEP